MPCTGTTQSGVYQVAFLGRAGGLSYTSRATMTCSFTFVEPSIAGTFEGTFTAVLRDSGIKADRSVTAGRFRIPRAP